MAVPIFMLISGYVYEKSCQHKQMERISQAYEPLLVCDKVIRLTIPVLIVYICNCLRLLSGKWSSNQPEICNGNVLHRHFVFGRLSVCRI